MRLRSIGPFAMLAVIAGAGISCSGDTPAAPATTAPVANSGGGSARGALLAAPITVIPLQRTTSLAQSQSVSATIGLLGGRLALPGAGLTVVVPPLAVVSPVTMTVTALAGSSVAYEFAPHGVRFLAPLVATQDLRNTEAASGGTVNPLSLFVGYFPDSSNITSVTELLNVRIDLLAQTSIVSLWHFSGYMWSSGREAADTSGSLAASVRRGGGASRVSRTTHAPTR